MCRKPLALVPIQPLHSAEGYRHFFQKCLVLIGCYVHVLSKHIDCSFAVKKTNTRPLGPPFCPPVLSPASLLSRAGGISAAKLTNVFGASTLRWGALQGDGEYQTPKEASNLFENRVEESFRKARCLGSECQNQIPQTGHSDKGSLYLTVLEVGSPRSRCLQSRSL